MNKLITKTKLILMALFILSASNVLSQTGQSLIENLRIELNRTDEIIERAREMVRASNAPAAALNLEQAIGIQKQAWDNFNRNTVDGYRFALKLTLQARELAKRALAASRLSEQGEDAVFSRLDRTEELLRQAHEALPTNADESLISLFETARRNLAQAWEFYRNGQYRPAIKLSNQVEKTARHLIQIANREQNFEGNFERRLEAAKQFIERVEGEVSNCNSEQARQLIRNARESLQLAMELSSKGQHEQAIRHLQQARKLAGQAADLCGRAKDQSANFDRLMREAENLRDQVKVGDDNGQRLLSQIFGQLDNAKMFISKNDGEGASAALRAAQLTIKQLQRYLNTGEI